jgi:hypothetical protein
MSQALEEPLAKRPCRSLAAAETEIETDTDHSSSIDNANDDKHSAQTILNPNIIQGLDDIAKVYREAKPYSHAVLDPVFVDGFAGMYACIYIYIYIEIVSRP